GHQQVLEALPARAQDAETLWDQEYQRRLFDWAAEQVRQNCREQTWQAFWRTAVEGQSGLEVAQALGMSPAAVYLAKRSVLDRLTAGSEPWLHAARGAEHPAPDPALRRVVRQLQEEGEPGEANEPDLGFLDPPAAPGSMGRLGPYDVVSVIGRGGMGVVLKAF